MKLKGRHVVITGGSGGIGRELGLEFLKKGARVFLLDINRDHLNEVVDELSSYGLVQGYVVDITKQDQLLKFTQHLKNGVDIWINNAGIATPDAFDKISNAQFFKVMDVNLNGVVLGIKIALSLMKKNQSGLIVNIASVAGHIPSPMLSSYAASKHAVVGLTRSLQMEYEIIKSPIQFCLVSPGFCDTSIMKSNPELDVPALFKSTPVSVAKAIVKGIEKDQKEIYPAFSGKVMMTLSKYAPSLLKYSARLFASLRTQ